MLFKDSGKIYGSLKVILEYLILTVITIYSFALGFFNGFSIPAHLGIEEATYLFSNMLFKPVSKLVIPYLTNEKFAGSLQILLGLSLILIFVNKYAFSERLKLKLQQSRTSTLLFLKNIFFAEMIIIPILTSIIFNYSHLEFRDTFSPLKEDYLIWKAGETAYLGSFFFTIGVTLLVILPATSLTLLEHTKSLISNKVYKITLFVFILFFSNIFAYHLGYEYSGNNLKFPSFRMNSSIDKTYKLIWKNGDEFYVVDCDDWTILKGLNKDGKEFYSNYFDANSHRGLCNESRK